MPEGNPDPNASSGNPDPNAGAAGDPNAAAGGEKWYSSLEGDLKDHPTIQKFESPSALAKGYMEVEKMVGGEKIINPFKLPEEKRADGMKKYNEAIGVPSDPAKYQELFVDPKDVPEGMSFNKDKFAEAVHDMGLRPDQAAKAYDLYTGEFLEGHRQANEAHQTQLNESETALRKEWGQAYDGNVQLATRFLKAQVGEDQAEFDRINGKFTTDPGVMKILAKAGKAFSENSIEGFKDPGSSRLTPQQAQEEYDNIVGNQKDDYYSDINSVRQRRIKYVESLCQQGADPMKIG